MVAQDRAVQSCADRLCDDIVTTQNLAMTKCAPRLLLVPHVTNAQLCAGRFVLVARRTTEGYLLPDRRFMNELSVAFCSQVNLLGAAPTKAAALIAFVPSLLAALLVTGTFGLALSSGSWGTGAATAA